MNSTSSSRQSSPTWTLPNMVFLLLMIALAAWSPVSVSAGSEPMISLPGGVPPQAAELLAAAAPARSDMLLHLRIYLELRDKEAARQLADDLQNTSSPNYHKWIDPKKFDELFGPLQASYDTIASWLTSQGFSVTAVRHDRRDLEFTGTIAQADQAFHVEIRTLSDGKHYGILSDPMTPTRFQGLILGVIGLDNLNAASPATTLSTPPGTFTAFAPADFYNFYDEAALLGAGINGSISGSPNECLAILGLSDYLAGAITAFDNQFLLPAPAMTTKYATTSSSCVPGPACDPGVTVDEDEALLDLEWGHAAAPGAPLIFYVGDKAVEGGSSSIAILDAFSLATTDNTCGTISISFQLCDFTGLGYAVWDQVAMSAATHGQSVFVSSDDFGAAGETYNYSSQSCNPSTSLGVNEISADTYVTSVGGTQFLPAYAGISGVPLYGQTMGTDVGFMQEGIWDVLSGQYAGATGGGESQIFSKPNYQAGRTRSDGQRDVPDIALFAGVFPSSVSTAIPTPTPTPIPGAFWGDDPQRSGSKCPGPGPCVSCCVGGTSLATVLWAGISKLIQEQRGARIGNINPELYSLAQLGPTAGLRDVRGNASPNNNGFNSVTGWPAADGYDQATGWGTPDITTFVNLFASNEVDLIGGSALGGSIQTGEAYHPASQTFTSLGNVMSAGRVNYGIAKLPNGKFLLAGGNNGSSILQTADIFDPVTDTFTQASHNMANPYFDFAQAVTLESQPSPTSGYAHGGVFIIGMDTTGNGKLWTEIYDPVSQTFTTPVKILGSNEPETGYTITLLGNSRFSGQVLIQGAGSIAELYDPIAKTFTATTNQPPLATLPGNEHSSLYLPAAVLLSNGKVLVAGGFAGTIYPSSFAYLYDPATNTFATTGSLNQARCEPFAVALPNGKAMVFGQAGQNNVFGSCTTDPTVEIYDPSTGTFTQTQMTTTRSFPYVSIVPNPGNNLTAQILIAGGTANGSILNTAELYDSTFGTFTALNSTMTTPSYGSGFAFPAR
jgi:Pro-kumamolisin, activation domain